MSGVDIVIILVWVVGLMSLGHYFLTNGRKSL